MRWCALSCRDGCGTEIDTCRGGGDSTRPLIRCDFVPHGLYDCLAVSSGQKECSNPLSPTHNGHALRTHCNALALVDGVPLIILTIYLLSGPNRKRDSILGQQQIAIRQRNLSCSPLGLTLYVCHSRLVNDNQFHPQLKQGHLASGTDGVIVVPRRSLPPTASPRNHPDIAVSPFLPLPISCISEVCHARCLFTRSWTTIL
jgi:hypothetical protein